MKIIGIYILVIICFGCEAPRNNPVDPNNENNRITELKGTVRAVSFPNPSIRDAVVRWGIEGISLNTDINGAFEFTNIPRKNGWLYAAHPDYSGDSVLVEWGDKRNISVQIQLNSRPVLDSLEIYSIVENRFQITQKYSVVVRARISDRDGQNDVDSVFVENPQLMISKRLVYNVTTNFYEQTLSLTDLNTASLNEIIGKDFLIKVIDLSNRIHIVGDSNVKRVINEEVVTDSPKSNEVVSFPFFLRWKRFTPGYKFHYLIQIQTNESPPELVWERDDVSSEEISYLIDTTFPGNSFYWTIWAIDEFNNRSRSKPATFQID